MRKKVVYLLFIIFISFYNCSKEINNNQEIPTKSNKIEKYLKIASDKNLSINERKNNLKKAYSIYRTLENNTYKRNKIRKISAIHYELKNYEVSKNMDKEMLQLSILSNDSIGIAKSYLNLGIHYRKKQVLDSAYYFFYNSNKIYATFGNQKKINKVDYIHDHGTVLIDLAKLSRKVKDYNESEALTVKAIEKFELSGNASYIPISYINLGIIAKQLGRFDDAIKYHLETIKHSKGTSKDTLYKVISYNNMGTTYKSQQKYDRAIEYYKKALSYKYFLSTRPKRFARLLDNLGYAKFLYNKKNDSVLYLLKRAYSIRDSIDDIVGISTSNLHLAEYYQSIGNNKLAKQYATKTKDISPLVNENVELLQAYDLLAQVSPPEEGRKYAMEYIKLSNSLTKRDNLFRDKFARIRFESENLEKENQQKKEEIVEIQNQNTIYLLGILLLATFIGFIIYFSRQRTKYLAQQNKIVEFQAAYETETRISKRLHDEIGNDIFQVMMQYQNDPHDPQITKKLNTAYTKARDISRENSEFEVDETYLEELTDMLTNYTKNNIRLVQRGIDKIVWNTMDKNLKITIYRVLQELMTNMQKHSQADLVAIVFKNEKNNLIIKYSDNGVGIQKSAIKSKNGLRNTEKRILAINGTIIFDSEKNKGFKAEIKIPC
ncbi:Histidine kinase-, DNA gyrase B-, and HSP90-like ATPase [Aquimarina amphilecti]|uniref:histidine kinase n=1 Tax=Aquimarina amphilecti TaxID=1038014 RepID=A0A1H7SED4_AQUAM|nr:tetratricopeptide repeat protein [Aquimarina amphilecti]SEL71041.1 Histidine kinase-, DNA gyrase B-, and HSP90-like ATPase [Aquimarina amphilecti]